MFLVMLAFVLYGFEFAMAGFWMLLVVYRGPGGFTIGSSGSLVGSISTRPGIYTSPWRQSFTVYGMPPIFVIVVISLIPTSHNGITKC